MRDTQAGPRERCVECVGNCFVRGTKTRIWDTTWSVWRVVAAEPVPGVLRGVCGDGSCETSWSPGRYIKYLGSCFVTGKQAGPWGGTSSVWGAVL